MMHQYIELQKQQLASEASSSRRKRKPRRYIERCREAGNQRLYQDYFSENPTYNEDIFRRRFRMRRDLFLRIVEGVKNHDPYFQSNVDCTGRQNLTPLQKCTAAMRMLAYGVAADAVDEYLRISEATTTKCVKRFVHDVIAMFGDEYLRRPNTNDIERLLYVGQQRGFSGTLNDINVLDRSPVFDEVLEGRAPEVGFFVNGNNYNLGYYLTDGIYPNWATFVKSIPLPQGPKRQLFAKKQEAARKDVERAFSVLQSRFAIVSGPSRMWDKCTIGQILRACIIMHNMIVEDERDSYVRQFDYTDDQVNFTVSMPEVSRSRLPEYQEYLRSHVMIRNRSTKHQLQADLVEEIWNRFGGEEHDD